METFLTEAAVRESAEKAKRRTWVFRGLIGLALAVFTVLCLLVRTGNARIMLYIAWGFVILIGWALIAWWMFALEPARAEERHRTGLKAAGEPSVYEGVFTLREGSFRIPKSVRIYKVSLDTGKETLSLNLAESLREKAPVDGSRVRVQTLRKFITGIEVLEPGPEAAQRRRPSRAKAVLRALARLFPAAVIWAMVAVMLTGFVFNRITDTDPAHKITIYICCEVRNAPELAERLERELEGAVRMVKVHPFAYAMFGSEAIRSADLYIVPDSRKAEFEEWFMPEDGEAEAAGIPVYDPETGLNVVGTYFLYAPEGVSPEAYRLYFGAGSPHLEDGLARRAAELLCCSP